VHGEEGLEQLGDFFDRRDLGNFRLIERLMTEVDRVRDIAQQSRPRRGQRSTTSAGDRTTIFSPEGPSPQRKPETQPQ